MMPKPVTLRERVPFRFRTLPTEWRQFKKLWPRCHEFLAAENAASLGLCLAFRPVLLTIPFPDSGGRLF